VTPLGLGPKKPWENLIKGKSGVDYITRFDTTTMKSKIAGEVKDFKPGDFIDSKEAKRMDLFTKFAMAAAVMALEMSELEITEKNAPRVGVLVGAGLGGLETFERFHKRLIQTNNPRKVSPFFIPMLISNMASGQIAIRSGAKGPSISISTACATGAHSIGYALRTIQYGDADVMITGGAEAAISPVSVSGFDAMRALAELKDDPKKASRPFDKERTGFVIAEGSGVVVLETLAHAKKRGAPIYGEIVGFGQSADAYHIAAPSPNGEGPSRCMASALKDARISPEEIDYINAHGTSTPLNDIAETKAIKNVFKDYAYKVPISSNKSMMGHLLGAAGAVESIFTILSIKEGIIPPTINYEFPDPECDLDYVPNEAREVDIKYAMSNSFGFGGTNATLVFKRFEG
jgi:3-oxoacyl-[acyl-carrier-protein] synthase II